MSDKLNLGCGEARKEGFINVDFHAHVGADIVHDLNVLPYPFKDDQFEHIEAFHVLEHLDKPFAVMRELHRVLKKDGTLHIKVPHFSRGMTHAEHAHGFDVTFPMYFDPRFTKSGYFGVHYELKKMELHWLAFFHLLPYAGYGSLTIGFLRLLDKLVSFGANLSPSACSRLWCFWVGGFDELEFHFKAIKIK